MKRANAMTTQHSALSTQLSSARRAFTLIELMVAVAILLAIMVMIGAIFDIAGKASGRAKSDSKLYSQAAAAADMIYQDLDGVRPGATRSGDAFTMLGIAGVEVSAYETPEDRVAGLPATTRRADLLMVVTARPFQPYICQDQSILWGPSKLVVYGHADFGRLDAGGNWAAGSYKYIEGSGLLAPGVSDMPACEWHLARRVVGFPISLIPSGPAGVVDFPNTNESLTCPAILSGQADVYNVYADWLADNVPPTFTKMGTPLPSELMPVCYHQSPTSGNWYLVQNGTPSYCDATHWFYFDKATSYSATTIYEWARRIGTNPPISSSTTELNDTLSRPVQGANWTLNTLSTVFYDASQPSTARRTVLAPSPPASLTQGMQHARLASYFLPACSEFKVEYTYDDPHEVYLTPGAAGGPPVTDTTGGLDIDGNATPDTPGPRPIRWQTVPNGQQWVWSRLSVDPNNRTDPFRWPRALRITIRAYGSGGASHGAVEQSIIHCW